jgi:MFS family permease
VAIVFGFAPWIVYWMLVGNSPFLIAALAALVSAVAALAVGRYQNAPGRSLEIGAVATFVVLALLSAILGEAVLERWMLPASYGAILVVTAVGVATGRPFVREFASERQPPHVLEDGGFLRATARLTWIWVGAFAAMTVSSLVPPVVDAAATIVDTEDPLAFWCYWVIPFLLFIAAVFATRIRPDELAAGANDAKRKTTFVAYSEAAIDELYYLAQEHANRLVGAGEEAYDVKVGGAGLPLVGDESRQSWPATYKVRQPRR